MCHLLLPLRCILFICAQAGVQPGQLPLYESQALLHIGFGFHRILLDQRWAHKLVHIAVLICDIQFLHTLAKRWRTCQ